MPNIYNHQILPLLIVSQSMLVAILMLQRRQQYVAILFFAIAAQFGANLAAQWFAWRDVSAAAAFVYGPVLLAIVTSGAWRHKRPSMWHAAPSVLALLTTIGAPEAATVLWLTAMPLLFGYLFRCFQILKLHEATLLHTRSDHAQRTLVVLRRSLYLLVAVALLDVLRQSMQRVGLAPELASWLRLASLAGLLGAALAVIWHGWVQPIGSAALEQVELEAAPGAPVLEKGATSDADAQRLHEFMVTEKPYRATDLTLAELAEQLGWPPRQLSQLINNHHGRNFNDFINAWRVLEAQDILSDPTRRNDKLLAVQLDVGFHSKSAFHAAFKREHGITPHAYRVMVGGGDYA